MKRWLPILLLLCASPAWAQFKMPDQRAGARSGLTLSNGTFNNATVKVTNGRISNISSGSGAIAGFTNTPTVTAGNPSTATFTTQCTVAGCTDNEIIANASNNNAIVMTTPASGSMTAGQFIFVKVVDSGTAPSDAYFVAGSGVTMHSLQAGITDGNLTGTSAADKLARQNSCGAMPTTGAVVYNFWWDGAGLYLTQCTGNPSGSVVNPALIGGAQWTSRAVTGTGGTDPIQTGDTLINVNANAASETEQLPACTSSNIGKLYIIKKTDSSVNSITLTPSQTLPDTIEGSLAGASVTLSAAQEALPIWCSTTAGTWQRELPIPWSHAFGGTDVTTVGSTGQSLQSTGSSFAVLSRPLRPGFSFSGAVANSAVISYACAETWNFPIGLSGTYPDAVSQATCGTSPSSASDYIISVGTQGSMTQKADVSLSTATPCVPTFTAATAFSCSAGQTLTITAPATTHGEANIAITLAGHTP